MRVEIKTVSPELARTFLEKNTDNRKVNKAQLEMLVRAMQGGHWRLTHQGVAMYDDGTIADGQHRLLAIVESGVSCKMPVFYGVEKTKSTTIAIDCGRGRTVVDGLKISGSGITGNSVTLAKGIEFGYEQRMLKLNHSEVALLCEKHSRGLELAKEILGTNKSGVSIAPVKVAILKCVEDGVSKELAAEFYNTLLTGEYNNPIMINAVRLRNKLMSYNYNGDRSTAYNITFNTLKATSEGRDLKRISSKK